MEFNGKTMTAYMTFTPAELNDEVISNTTWWSSQNTIEKLCPRFAEVGDGVVCEPMEGSLLLVSSQLPQTADGIKSCTLIHRSGRNLFGAPSYVEGTYTVNGVKFTVNTDKSITISTDNGGCTALTKFDLLGSEKDGANRAELGVLNGGKLTASTGVEMPEGVAISVVFKDANGGTVTTGPLVKSGYKSKTISFGKTEKFYFYIRIFAGTVIKEPITIYPMLEDGIVTTTYVPHWYEEHTVDFGEPITNGEEYDWNTGVLKTKTGEEITFDPLEIHAGQGKNIIAVITSQGELCNTAVGGRKDLALTIESLEKTVKALLEG